MFNWSCSTSVTNSKTVKVLTSVNVLPEDPELGVVLKPHQTALLYSVYLQERAAEQSDN